ncbi:MAG: hypothetical protein OEX83_01150 [Gammaproteobacteria bacterium]|nr:hypothetical protein [Gammaproteobacteria bacterium]
MTNQNPFSSALRGSFTSALRWEHLDEFWKVLHGRSNHGWYIYAVGEEAPVAPASENELKTFVSEIDVLLRQEHEEDYCGIVYADNLEQPTIIKIYDPNNLGVSCGFSDNPPLPGWILSLMPPVTLASTKPPGNRRRWWQKLFHTS